MRFGYVMTRYTDETLILRVGKPSERSGKINGYTIHSFNEFYINGVKRLMIYKTLEEAKSALKSLGFSMLPGVTR